VLLGLVAMVGLLGSGCAWTPGPDAATPGASLHSEAEASPADAGTLVLRGHPWVGRVWSVETRRLQAGSALLEGLEAHRFVLLGEMHDNPDHHRRQARVLRHLVSAGRRPALVVEMLSADVAGALEKARARPDAGPEDLRRAVAWDTSGWPAWEIYAPLFEAALEADLPVVPGDLAGSVLDALRRDGLAGLDPPLRRGLGLDVPVPDAWRRALRERLQRAHCDLLPEEALPRMVDVQLARDAHLARALAEAAEGHGEGAVLVAGAGHVRRDQAVPAWLERRGVAGSLASVALMEVHRDAADPTAELRERFGGSIPYDRVWFTPRHPREDPCEALRERLHPGTGEGAGDRGPAPGLRGSEARAGSRDASYQGPRADHR